MKQLHKSKTSTGLVYVCSVLLASKLNACNACMPFESLFDLILRPFILHWYDAGHGCSGELQTGQKVEEQTPEGACWAVKS